MDVQMGMIREIVLFYVSQLREEEEVGRAEGEGEEGKTKEISLRSNMNSIRKRRRMRPNHP